MLNNAVSTGNVIAGRMISGILNLSLDHPFALICVLALLAGLCVSALLDVIGTRTDAVPRS